MVDFGFHLGREDGYPTRYGDQHSPARVDVIVAGLITSFLILAIALFAIIPSYNSIMRKVIFGRIVCSLFIGGVILIGNYGHHWEHGTIHMSAPYKPGVPDEIAGELGLHIALRGINITLKGEPAHHDTGNVSSTHKDYSSPLAGERINYNEHFSWEWAQGRFGFGKYAGRISRDFRAAVYRGVPLPILQVAEYFTFDGEGIRFGRHYRLAGWYSHLILWFAFGTWLISNVLFCMVVRTAALFLFITGCLQLAAIGVWTYVRNFIELQIPFQDYDGKKDIILETSYGADFYLVLINGIFCIILAGAITLMDAFMADDLCLYFGIDPLTIYDELLLSKAEIREENRKLSILKGRKHADDIEMQDSDNLQETGQTFLRRRSNNMATLVRKSFRHVKPRIPRRSKPSPSDAMGDERSMQSLLHGENTSDDDDKGKSGDQNLLVPPNFLKPMPPTPPPKPTE